TALVSALSGRAVRRDVAMTGEITLRGNVLPIGGLKEKALSAHRAGITTILSPYENERDIEDIPKSVRDDLTFIPVKHMEEVLQYALVATKDENTQSSIYHQCCKCRTISTGWVIRYCTGRTL